MIRINTRFALVPLALIALAAAEPAKPPVFPAPSEIVAAAPASDWVTIAPADMLVMTLTPDAKGAARKVVIQLMPPPFSQGWVGNIRKLAAAHWYDGTSINRVQDNYVVQWGDANGDDTAKAKKLPTGLAAPPEKDYVARFAKLPAVVTFPGGGGDAYAGATGMYLGWPFVTDLRSDGADMIAWPVHCYGMVGVGRNLSPDTGSGAELYTVIGHAPRHLDRNIALVGRVIAGIENLSSLPRGTESLGVYKTPEERTAIVSIRLASELPPAEQPRFQYLSTESATFAKYADARANRRDPFFIVPAGGADICNIPVPIRPAP